MSKSCFTSELQASVSSLWDEVVHHKFTKELAANTIDREVLKRYLIQDHRFLDSFVILLSSIVANVHSLEDRIPGCQFLGLVTSSENTYFERCFEKLGCTKDQRLAIPDAPCTRKFCELMREVAFSGSLGEMLAVITVCEWSYLSWGELVKPQTVRDDFLTYEWVDLHSGLEFQGVVAYFRRLLDEEGERMSEEEKDKCKQRFKYAVEIEKEFFDFAYE